MKSAWTTSNAINTRHELHPGFYILRNESAIHIFVDRMESKEPQPSKRISSRKLIANITTARTPIEKLQVGEKNQVVKRTTLSRLNKNGVAYLNGTSFKSNSTEDSQIKRGKRTLTLEKDKSSPRSVKVLRRSHILISNIHDKPQNNLRLPSVKVNKTI